MVTSRKVSPKSLLTSIDAGMESLAASHASSSTFMNTRILHQVGRATELGWPVQLPCLMKPEAAHGQGGDEGLSRANLVGLPFIVNRYLRSFRMD